MNLFVSRKRQLEEDPSCAILWRMGGIMKAVERLPEGFSLVLEKRAVSGLFHNHDAPVITAKDLSFFFTNCCLGSCTIVRLGDWEWVSCWRI